MTFLLTLLSGCTYVEAVKDTVSTVRNFVDPRARQIKQTQQEIATSKQTIASLQKSVRRHETVVEKNRKTYSTASNWLKFTKTFDKENGQCLKPSSYKWRRKPQNACADNSEADELATAMCVKSVGGPEACSLVAGAIGKKRGVPMYNFLSSTACGAAIAKMNNEEYTQENFLGDFALGMFQDYLDNLQRQGNYLEAMLGNAIYSSLLLNKFDGCMKNARYSCSQLYTVWKEEVGFRKVRNGKDKLSEKCQNNLKQINTASSNIQNAKAEMAPLKQKIRAEKKRLKELEKQLNKLNQGRRR